MTRVNISITRINTKYRRQSTKRGKSLSSDTRNDLPTTRRVPQKKTRNRTLTIPLLEKNQPTIVSTRFEEVSGKTLGAVTSSSRPLSLRNFRNISWLAASFVKSSSSSMEDLDVYVCVAPKQGKVGACLGEGGEAEGGGGGVKCYQELNTLLLCQFHHGICGVAAFFCVFSSDPSSPKSLRRDDFFRRPQEPNLSA